MDRNVLVEEENGESDEDLVHSDEDDAGRYAITQSMYHAVEVPDLDLGATGVDESVFKSIKEARSKAEINEKKGGPMQRLREKMRHRRPKKIGLDNSKSSEIPTRMIGRRFCKKDVKTEEVVAKPTQEVKFTQDYRDQGEMFDDNDDSESSAELEEEGRRWSLTIAEKEVIDHHHDDDSSDEMYVDG